MPRLSLYKPEKSADYRFIDKTVYEAFQIGGTDIFVHKYLGPVEPGVGTPTQPKQVSDIPGKVFWKTIWEHKSTLVVGEGVSLYVALPYPGW